MKEEKNNENTSESPKPMEMNYFEKNLFGVPIKKIYTLIPGIIILFLLGSFSIWLSNFIGITLMGYEKSPISSVMIILLLGMVINNLIEMPELLKPGYKFAVKKLLRLGIILLGIRLSVFSVLELGIIGVPIVVGCIVGALLITTFLNKKLGQPKRLGTLIAVGTSICGVSAIVAASPAIDAKEEETAYAVAVITVFGLLATLIYPIVAYFLFGGDAVKAGLWLGTSIHDTSQVTGSATVFADMWGLELGQDVAVVTKLVRNVFMVAIIPLMAFYYSKITEKEEKGSKIENKAEKNLKPKTNIKKLFPMFVLGFLLISIFRSVGDAGINTSNIAFGLMNEADWDNLVNLMKTGAGNLFVISLGGVGLSTKFSKFKGLGIKPFIVGLSAALTTGLISFALISLIGGFIVMP
ncbi:MAG: putative sulfate exporter family transporter [archaeon]|nr:putative sulfate exporter family transporter [archaeon]